TPSTGSSGLGSAECGLTGAPHSSSSKPETVIAWHRKGFRLFWTWKVRRGPCGRPSVPKDVRDLIRSDEPSEPNLGSPQDSRRTLKLGMNIGETSVSKYLDRHRKPPLQTWRTFLEFVLRFRANASSP